MDFVRECVYGEVPFWQFDTFYDHNVNTYYPKMRNENPMLAEMFADLLDSAVDYARDCKLPEDDYRELITERYEMLVGKRPFDIL
jgi:hypothetical protein